MQWSFWQEWTGKSAKDCKRFAQPSAALRRSLRWFQRRATPAGAIAAVNMARYFSSDIPLRASAHFPGPIA